VTEHGLSLNIFSCQPHIKIGYELFALFITQALTSVKQGYENNFTPLGYRLERYHCDVGGQGLNFTLRVVWKQETIMNPWGILT
jgi:hypothetical protein